MLVCVGNLFATEKSAYQNVQHEVGRLPLNADTVDLTDLVADVDEAGPVGCAAVHYSRDHNLAGDLAGFYGRPLMSRCKLVLSLRCVSRANVRAY